MSEESDRLAREEAIRVAARRQGQQDQLLAGLEKQLDSLSAVVLQLSDSMMAMKLKLAALSAGAAGGTVAIIEAIKAWN